MNATDATKLPVGVFADQPSYLIGNFIVTAASDQKAILRFVDAKTPIRIVAEYSAGAIVPAEGSKLNLDKSRGLLIREVRRAHNNASLLVYVREITVP